MNATPVSTAQPSLSTGKSAAAWLLTASIAAIALVGMAKSAKADVIWTVAANEPGAHVVVSNAPQFAHQRPVVVQQPVAVAPVLVHRHPAPVVVVNEHQPHGQAHGYWRHHHWHHRHHHGYMDHEGHHGGFDRHDQRDPHTGRH